MTVFAIYIGYDYESGHIGGVFSTRDKAVVFLEKNGYREKKGFRRGRTGEYAEIEEMEIDYEDSV